MNGVPIKDNRDLSRKVAALQRRPDRNLRRLAQRQRDDDQRRRSPSARRRHASRQRPAATATRIATRSGNSGKANVADLGLESRDDHAGGAQPSSISTATATGVLITEVDPDSDAAETRLARRRSHRRRRRRGGALDRATSSRPSTAAKSQKRPSVLLFVVTMRAAKRRYVPVKLGKG